MSDEKTSHAEALDEFRHQNFAWLLIRLLRDFELRIQAELEHHDHGGRLAHAMVMVHLPLEGGRLTELAAAAGVTKQSMGGLVDDMERFGYVERIPDAEDGRAKRICFTEAGARLLEESRGAVARIWSFYAGVLGERRLLMMRNSLATLLRGLEDAGEVIPTNAPR